MQLLGERVGTMVHEASLGQACPCPAAHCTCAWHLPPPALCGGLCSLRHVKPPHMIQELQQLVAAVGCTRKALRQHL